VVTAKAKVIASPNEQMHVTAFDGEVYSRWMVEAK
jgi:hypothetical protein